MTAETRMTRRIHNVLTSALCSKQCRAEAIDTKILKLKTMASEQSSDTQGLLSDNSNQAYEAIESKSSSTLSNDPENGHKSKRDDEEVSVKDEAHLPLFNIACILSTAFAYGCVMTTLFLITLPVECERIESQHPNIPKSVALGIFVAIAGVTQLISPFVGMLSDTYRPPIHFELGQRMPYLCLGAICSVVGLFGQYAESYEKLWLRYGGFFLLHMIGLNISYAMMIALIPDQVPSSQTGVANGILALLIVTGSLAGFGLFHTLVDVYGNIQDMYGEFLSKI